MSNTEWSKNTSKTAIQGNKQELLFIVYSYVFYTRLTGVGVGVSAGVSVGLGVSEGVGEGVGVEEYWG